MYKIYQIKPFIGKEEIMNVQDALNDKWITEGNYANEFIEKIKEITKAKYVFLVPNGTLAIYLSLASLDVRQKDEVIIPDFTFNASSSPVRFLGGKPVFVDVNDGDFNIDVSKIEESINVRTKAIMPVHIYGQCCDMSPLLELAEKHGLKVIEDSAEAFGVKYNGKSAGTIGDVGVYSFFADKTVTTGEGGAIVTNDDELALKIKIMRNQGREKSGSFKHPHIGMNFRMTDLQCAVGCAQLDKFNEIRFEKIENFIYYKSLLEDCDVRFIEINKYSTFIPFRVPIRVNKKEKVMDYLEENEVQTRSVFYPLHRQPCWRYLDYKKNDFPVSNNIFNEGICLPVYPGLKDYEIEYICEKIIEVL